MSGDKYKRRWQRIMPQRTVLRSMPKNITLWRHQMETFSALLVFRAENSSVTGEFHAQRPVTRSFDVFFDQTIETLVT